MIKVLSYGSGNVKAIVNIYKRLNIPCEVANSADELKSATKLVLPGVGAFDQTMSLLDASGMRSELNEMVTRRNVPVLGVCVGMQIMARDSEEGGCRGLGWVDGTVQKIDVSHLSSKPKLPHMGWNSVEAQRCHPILQGIDYQKGFYFLHSYRFVCDDSSNALMSVDYGGQFTSAINSENVYGFQFHPEKSHSNGILIFKNFAEL